VITKIIFSDDKILLKKWVLNFCMVTKKDLGRGAVNFLLKEISEDISVSQTLNKIIPRVCNHGYAYNMYNTLTSYLIGFNIELKGGYKI
jgi:hypothetical protein